ncbi:hypothetical protein PGT21_026840 [Puccinia graminis f. sp. tritici]|uniref:Uncharacterized protein n=1 Tax=Puccinia graminis f. sp. tritici TaxID=56615 RepID=A0A5B0M008_PUCGR|nr:hypothetical protein PGT21_026840 [Puccinia graminis f. sp. tritici]
MLQRCSFRSHIFCFTVVLAAPPMMIDLNTLPGAEEGSNEVRFSTRPTIRSIPSVASEIFPGKRTVHPVQLSSLIPPTRRARLSQAEGGLSSSALEFINPRFIAEYEFDPYHCGVLVAQASSRVDGSVLENKTTSRSIIGSNDNSASQLSSRGSQLGQPSDRVDPAPIETKLPGLPTITPEDWNYGYFLSNGALSDELLNTFGERFRQRINSKECHASNSRTIDKHPTLSFARVYRATVKQKITRVLHHKGTRQQSAERLLTLYTRLAASLFKLHGQFLMLLNIPIVYHRKQQQHLFEWLEKEFFSPQRGLALLGPVDRPELPWQSDTLEVHIGEIQVELIKYFSEERYNPISCTSYLLNRYRDHHAKEYLALLEFSNTATRNTKQMSMEPNFREILEILTSLAGSSFNRILENVRLDFPGKDEAFFEPLIRQFKRRVQLLSFIKPRSWKSYYPNQHIAMCFNDESSHLKPLRLINSKDGTLLPLSNSCQRFRTMLKMMDFLHIVVLNKLGIEDSEYFARRMNVCQFILGEMIHPEGSLPLIGSVEVPGTIAPWYSISGVSPNSFGEIQLKILQFFSGDLNDPNMIIVSLFLLATWYHKNYPDQLREFYFET